MTIPGANDYQAQVAGSLVLADTIAVSITAQTNFDLTALLPTNAAGVLCYWLQDPFAGGPILAQLLAGESFLVVSGENTLLASGDQYTFPIPTNLVVADSAASIQLRLSLPSGSPSPLVGTMFVFAMVQPQTVIPTVHHAYIGTGFGSGGVNVSAGATTTILAAPAAGTYYRLKLICSHIGTAPSATAVIHWQLGSIMADFARFQASTAATQNFDATLDIECDSAVQVINNTSSTVGCSVAYELWNV